MTTNYSLSKIFIYYGHNLIICQISLLLWERGQIWALKLPDLVKTMSTMSPKLLHFLVYFQLSERTISLIRRSLWYSKVEKPMQFVKSDIISSTAVELNIRVGIIRNWKYLCKWNLKGACLIWNLNFIRKPWLKDHSFFIKMNLMIFFIKLVYRYLEQFVLGIQKTQNKSKLNPEFWVLGMSPAPNSEGNPLGTPDSSPIPGNWCGNQSSVGVHCTLEGNVPIEARVMF